MTYRAPRIVIAVPTISERAHLRDGVEAAWRRHTCQPVEVIFSEAPGGWCAGLNAIWEQVRDPAPYLFALGSDDMVPADDNWLPPLVDYIERGALPAPCVIDPRFVNYGGHLKPVPDGTPSDMASFIVISGQWGDTVFPLPEELSYYGDNLACVKLARAGIPCVAVPSSRIRHLWAQEGRGFGHGSEEQAMREHSRLFTNALTALGVSRESLPKGQRGPLLAS